MTCDPNCFCAMVSRSSGRSLSVTSVHIADKMIGRGGREWIISSTCLLNSAQPDLNLTSISKMGGRIPTTPGKLLGDDPLPPRIIRGTGGPKNCRPKLENVGFVSVALLVRIGSWGLIGEQKARSYTVNGGCRVFHSLVILWAQDGHRHGFSAREAMRQVCGSSGARP